jgi:hypothetical protein
LDDELLRELEPKLWVVVIVTRVVKVETIELSETCVELCGVTTELAEVVVVFLNGFLEVVVGPVEVEVREMAEVVVEAIGTSPDIMCNPPDLLA